MTLFAFLCVVYGYDRQGIDESIVYPITHHLCCQISAKDFDLSIGVQYESLGMHTNMYDVTVAHRQTCISLIRLAHRSSKW